MEKNDFIEDQRASRFISRRQGDGALRGHAKEDDVRPLDRG